MKRCISIIAVLLTVSTQANAHPSADHSNADHKHGLLYGIIPEKDVQRYTLSPASCNDPSVKAEEWIPIYKGCMYAHRDDLARSGKGTSGYQVRRIIKEKCERTACEPTWWDKVKYK